ncbi:MAG: anti-sigma factor family protein [Bacteroidota bacterium]
MNHLTDNQIQDYIEKSLGDGEMQEITMHLKSCLHCMQMMRKHERVEKVIRRSLMELAPDGLTDNVMKQLGLRESPSYAWNIFKNLAPVVALFSIGAIIVFVYKITGALSATEIQSTVQTGQSVYAKLGENINTGVTGFNNWVRTYLPFAFTGKSLGLTAFLCFFFIAIGLLDKYIFVPMLRRGKNS